MADLRHRGRGRGPAGLRREAHARSTSVDDRRAAARRSRTSGSRRRRRRARATGARPVRPDDARFALAAAVRRVITAMVRRPCPTRTLVAATAAIDAVADGLDGGAGPGRRPRAQPDPTGHPQDFFPTSPVIGFANPVAPPVRGRGGRRRTARDGLPSTTSTRGRRRASTAGCIALVFDEMLGAANIAAGQPGMTGTLTIRYRRPTPLRTPLRLEARFVGARRPQDHHRRARSTTATSCTAEAEGIFIELVPERFIEIGEPTDTADVRPEATRADPGRRAAGSGRARRDYTPSPAALCGRSPLRADRPARHRTTARVLGTRAATCRVRFRDGSRPRAAVRTAQLTDGPRRSRDADPRRRPPASCRWRLSSRDLRRLRAPDGRSGLGHHRRPRWRSGARRRRTRPRSSLGPELVHPEDAAAGRGALRSAGRRRPGVRRPRARYRPRDGSWRSFEWTARLEAGTGLVAGVARDVTERHRARPRAAHERGRLQAILDHSTAAVFVKDLRGRFVLVNDAFLEPARAHGPTT